MPAPFRRQVTRASEATLPQVIENLRGPQARIYQLTEDDLAVVLIVDESLDL